MVPPVIVARRRVKRTPRSSPERRRCQGGVARRGGATPDRPEPSLHVRCEVSGTDAGSHQWRRS